MVTININEFHSNINKYINLVKNGVDIIISEKNKPIFFIEPIKKLKKRPYGLCKGDFIVPDNFNEELPKNILLSFEGK